MDDVFLFAAHNTVVALVFALFVYGLARVWRNPPVAHVLWVLVLLKLVAPPVMRVDWPPLTFLDSILAPEQVVADVSRIEGRNVKSHPRFADWPTAWTTGPLSTKVGNHGAAFDLRTCWSWARPVLLGIWLGGAALCALVAAMRIVRFERRLRGTLPASERLQRLALEIGGKLGVRRRFDVRYVESAEVPLLWCAGGCPTIVLPMRLIRQLDDEQAAMILAHELAHLRRRDHWVRAAELAVAIVYWWNPLVWMIRRQIHQAEDLCCDSWVRWAFPGRMKCYAEVVLKTAESLSASRFGARLLPASYFLQSQSLKGRIEMVLRSKFTPRISTKSMLVIGLLALLMLPTWMRTNETEAWAGPNETAGTPRAGEPKPTTSEFPFKVQFEQGATRFESGDEITIEEVRGTAETFLPGQLYWIKGTYKLNSRERAGLSAYTTAMEAKDGTSSPLKVQSVRVDRGSGTFTLFLPMTCRGWPHVSFYPLERGESFGGNYFGTGESVLKRWWGSKGNE